MHIAIAMVMKEIISMPFQFVKTKKPGRNVPPGVRALAFILRGCKRRQITTTIFAMISLPDAAVKSRAVSLTKARSFLQRAGRKGRSNAQRAADHCLSDNGLWWWRR